MNFMRSAILPASTYTKEEIASFDQKVSKKFERTTLAVDKNITLEGVMLSPGKKRHILFFLPNGMIWQESEHFLKDVQKIFNATVICYNYRGCGNSQGKIKNVETFFHDGVKQVEALTAKGIKHSDILFYGYSLGGAIALCTAESLQKKGLQVDVIAERSFRSITAVFKNAEEIDIPLLKRPLGFLGQSILTASGWNLNPEKALDVLQGKVVVIYNDHDDVIDKEASLQAAVREKKKDAVISISMDKVASDDGEHNRQWSASEKKRIASILKSTFK